MRRLTAAAVLTWLVFVGIAIAAPAAAQPEPTEPAEGELVVPEPIPGEPVCTITDTRLRQLSGLVATEDGYFTANDGSGVQGVFELDSACQVVEQMFYESLDPEDMELDRDSSVLWVADTGDNFETTTQQPRVTVALWRIDLAGDRIPVIHRFIYQDGQARDAEALLLDSDGMPLIVTKAVGTAEIFRPVDLVANNPHEQAVALEKLGELSIPDTGTEHDRLPSSIASRAVTGGAVAPDGSRVVLRTYTDALEFDVADGDIVGALVDGVPRITPLPHEPHGEAITYTADGERFVTVSEAPDDLPEYLPELLSYTPAQPPPEPTPVATEAPAASGGSGGFINSPRDIINVIAAIGVFGLLLVIAGVIGIVRARRRAAAAPAGDPPAGPVTGRARLTGDQPGAAGAAGVAGVASAAGDADGGAPEPAGGVYTSSTARQAGQPADGYPQPGHGADYGQPGGEYHGGEYQAGGYPGGEYHGGDYQAGGYPGGEYRGGDYQASGEYHGGEYPHGQYQGGQYAGGQYGQPRYPGEDHQAGYPQQGYPQQGYGQPGYDPERYSQAGYGGEGYGSAGPVGDGYGDPAYGDRGHGQSGYGTPGHGEPGYGDPAYGGGGYPAGGGGHGGYGPGGRPDQPYDQDWPDHPAGGRQAGYGEPTAAGPGQQPAGGGYGPAADDYSDDPDYPYEFRQPGRW